MFNLEFVEEKDIHCKAANWKRRYNMKQNTLEGFVDNITS